MNISLCFILYQWFVLICIWSQVVTLPLSVMSRPQLFTLFLSCLFQFIYIMLWPVPFYFLSYIFIIFFCHVISSLCYVLLDWIYFCFPIEWYHKVFRSDLVLSPLPPCGISHITQRFEGRLRLNKSIKSLPEVSELDSLFGLNSTHWFHC